MNTTSDGAVIQFSRSARVLRTLFTVGFAVQAVDSVVPDVRLAGKTLQYWLETGGTDRLVSDLDLIRFCFRLGLLGWGFYNMLMWVAPFAFIALAMKNPRRWVFVTGAVFAIYQLLFEYVGPQNSEIHVAPISLVLINIARAMALVGFWVKPMARDLVDERPANTVGT